VVDATKRKKGADHGPKGVPGWAGIAITITDCGEDDSGAGPGGGSGDVSGTVTDGGHSHSGAVVTEAQIMAGSAVNLTLTGNGHTHTVALTAQDVVDVGAGTQVVKTSSNDAGHEHTVTFN
jgi:hypothetical protein